MVGRKAFTVRAVGAAVAVFVPAGVVAVGPLAPLAVFGFVGLVPVLIALLHGRRFAVVTSGATAVVVVLVEVAHPSPVAAVALMVLLGFGIGVSSVRGWHAIAAVACSWPAVLLVGPSLDVSTASVGLPGAVLVLLAGVVTLVGGLWTVLVARILLPDLPVAAFTPVRAVVAVIYGVALAVTLGIATAGALAWGGGSTAGWLLLTILVVARPAYSETWRRIVNRTLGTVGGGVAAAALALLMPVAPVLTVVGALSMAAAIILLLKKANYAVYAAALTAAIVLLNASSASVIEVDIARVLFTVLGALLAAVVVFVIQLALGRRDARRGRVG